MTNLTAFVSRRRLLTFISVFGLLSCLVRLAATPVAFDIAPQAAATALELFIKQSGAQVVYLQDDVKDLRTNALTGQFEPKAAIDLLLKGTGLIYTERKAGQFTVGRAAAKPGSVTGSLMAPGNRASVTGVIVTVRETGATARVDEHGSFRIPELPPGTYTLAAAGEGFSRLRITDVVVVAGVTTELGVQEMPVQPRDGDVQTMKELVVSAKDVETLSAFSVTSDRLKPFITNNVDLPRTIDDVQPYYVWFSNKIESSGATDVQDFFKKMVPMDANRQSTQQQPNGQSFSNISLGGFDGGSGLNTAQNTLVLVDGLPLPNTSYSTRTYGPNLSSIPVGAIDHIEVMPASGSAIYGASAVGGVVNIVMKHEYNGAELSLTYDNTFSSDAPKRSTNLSYGRTLEGGKTKLLLTANYSTEKPLLVQDRFKQIIGPYQARYGGNYIGGLMTQIGLATATGAITAPSAVYLNQPIIASVSGAPLFAGNPASVVQVPAGYQSFQANGIAPLQANLGKFDLSLPNTNTTVGSGGLREPLTQGYANKALSLGLRRQMTDWVELYAQAGTQTNYSPEFTSYAQFSSVVVPANAPGNPFGQAVKVSGVQQNVPGAPGILYNTITQGASTGARFTLPHEWKADLNYTWGLTSVGVYNLGSLDSVSIAAAANNGSLNLITDVSRYPFNELGYTGFFTSSQRTSANTALLKAVGPLMKLWAGAPTLAVGIEHQKNGGKGGYQFLSNPAAATVVGVAPTATLTQYAYWPGGSTTDNSGYGELSVPLVRKANQIPLVKQFDVQLAGRYDDYVQQMTSPVQAITVHQVGGGTTYNPTLLTGALQPFTLGKGTRQKTNETAGFKYKPVDSVFFRWSYSTAFIPPVYSQVVTPISTGTITQTTGAYPGVPTTAPWAYSSITDTLLGNAVYTVPTKSGGNPDLKPETSKSMNWGVVFEPTFMRGLRVSLDYVKVTKHDAIITPTAATLIPFADQFPGRVTRGTPNAGQTVGPIVLLDITNINAPEIITSSYNLKLDYTLRTTALGRFDFSTIASSWQHYKTQSTIGGAIVEQLNNPNTTVVNSSQSLGLAKFKGTAGVDWSKGPFTAGWTTRYVSPYTLGSRFGIGGTFPTQGTVNGWVSSQIYHDVYVGVKLISINLSEQSNGGV